jgi:hypothetical protein
MGPCTGLRQIKSIEKGTKRQTQEEVYGLHAELYAYRIDLLVFHQI